MPPVTIQPTPRAILRAVPPWKLRPGSRECGGVRRRRVHSLAQPTSRTSRIFMITDALTTRIAPRCASRRRATGATPKRASWPAVSPITSARRRWPTHSCCWRGGVRPIISARATSASAHCSRGAGRSKRSMPSSAIRFPIRTRSFTPNGSLSRVTSSVRFAISRAPRLCWRKRGASRRIITGSRSNPHRFSECRTAPMRRSMKRAADSTCSRCIPAPRSRRPRSFFSSAATRKRSARSRRRCRTFNPRRSRRSSPRC